MLKSIVTIFVLFGVCTATTFAGTMYDADFSTAGQGSTHDTVGDAFETSPINGTNWELSFGSLSSDTTTNSFITSGGNMTVSDWGGNGTITGNAVTISQAGTVDFTGAGSGGMFNAAAEFFEWFYIVNGTTTSFGNQGTGTASGTTFDASVTGISVSPGDTVQIGFTINVNGTGDGADISSLCIDFTPVPEPSPMALILFAVIPLVSRRRRRSH